MPHPRFPATRGARQQPAGLLGFNGKVKIVEARWTAKVVEHGDVLCGLLNQYAFKRHGIERVNDVSRSGSGIHELLNGLIPSAALFSAWSVFERLDFR